MKITGKYAGRVAGTGALAILLATSAFADWRPRDGSWRDNRDPSNYNRGNRDYDRDRGSNHNRFSDSGHIRSFSRERGGYRVFVDGGRYPYWIPEGRLHGHRLSVGLSIRLGGIYNPGYGYVDVDDLGWPDDGGYYDDNDGYYGNGAYSNGDVVRGIVDGVNYRRGVMYLRSDRGPITVDMRSLDRRYSRLDIGDVRRGDRVTISGQWIRGGVFDAARIDSIRGY